MKSKAELLEMERSGNSRLSSRTCYPLVCLIASFFISLLISRSVPRAPLTPASRKPDPFRNGLSSHLTNHTPARSVATPLQNRKANGDASRGRASLLAGGNHVDESDIGTPGSVTASGNKKGKKRKAPREE